MECFTSLDCSGGYLSTIYDARECCVESDDSMSYITSDGSCMSCIGEQFVTSTSGCFCKFLSIFSSWFQSMEVQH